MMYRKWVTKKEARKIFPISVPPLPYGYFDRKGRFISIRNELRKQDKLIKSISGVNPELLGS